MNKYIKPYIFISLFSLYSCEDFFEFSVDMDISAHQSKLAPSSILTNAEENRTIFLSRSIGALENYDSNDILFVEGASVSINNVPLSYIEDPNQKGFYKLNDGFQFIPNDAYELKIEKSGFTTVTSQQVMPTLVPIIEAEIQNDVLQLKFQDIPGEEDFYMVEMYYMDNIAQSKYYVNLEPYTDEANWSVLTNGLVFRDSYFDGQQHTFKAKFYNDYSSGSGNTFYIRLYHISKDLYLHEKSVDLNYETYGNPFAEPSLVYTNVTNGYGVFGLANRDEVIIVQ